MDDPVASAIREFRLVSRSPNQLRLHPAVKEIGWPQLGEAHHGPKENAWPSFEPVIITNQGIVISGAGIWQRALRERRDELACIECDASAEEALRIFVASNGSQTKGSSFIRVCLAFTLEPYFREQAIKNMRQGGTHKDSTNLTEAQHIETHAKIAAAAGVSEGTTGKVKQILRAAHPEIKDAAKLGEISIHMAWKICRHPGEQQLTKLEELRSIKGTNQTSRRLIQKHVEKLASTELFPATLGDLLNSVAPEQRNLLDEVFVSEIEAPGSVAYLTRAAMESLRTAGR